MELLLRNGTVWTGVPGAPVADALLVRDGLIVGFDARDAVDAETVDLAGGFLLPRSVTGTRIRCSPDRTSRDRGSLG